jgi:hypothetical protein
MEDLHGWVEPIRESQRSSLLPVVSRGPKFAVCKEFAVLPTESSLLFGGMR